MKEPRWLTEAQIVAIHERLLSEHGGLPGVRSLDLLRSALDRPRNLFAYGKPSLFEMGAAYAFGIAKNHPFSDGNKHSAFMAAYTFLGRNKIELAASEEHVVFVTLELAAGKITQEDFAVWLKKNSV